MRKTAGSIFFEHVPDTIIKSAWRGEGRATSMPKRARSYLLTNAAIISNAQQANPKPSGHMDDLRDQFTNHSRLVTCTVSFK
jgi:hypothetical protein